jgi:hypothetical protein
MKFVTVEILKVKSFPRMLVVVEGKKVSLSSS